jgi:hypothetical protein
MCDVYQAAPDRDDPFAMLRADHAELDRLGGLLDPIVERERDGVLDAAARETLERILRRFSVLVPRHAADEQGSLFPRLHAALVTRLSSALLNLRTVEWQHIVAEAAHWLLNDMGEELVRQGRFETPAKRARFARLVDVLWRLYQEHHRLEEEEVLPLAARVLRPDDLRAIAGEMEARRLATPHFG